MSYQSKHTGTNIDSAIDSASEISTLQQDISIHSSEISSLKLKDNTLSSDISTINSNITTINNNITTINNNINTKAPMYQYSTTDIGVDATLATGTLYFVY